MDIRPLSALDRDTLKRIITGYTSDAKYLVRREESDAKSVISLELVALDPPYVKAYEEADDETFERYQHIIGEGLSSGAYEGAELVGLAIAEAHQWNASMWLWEFHVAQGQRGRGIGKALMAALAERGRAAGLRAIFCETQTTNVPAIRFYRSVGFALEGINLSLYTNDDWPDGEIAVFMKRPTKVSAARPAYLP